MSLGNFQKETLTLKISKQPEHEARAQVKSKLENSNTAYVSVLVPAAHFPAVLGTESANVPGLWVWGGCSPLSTGPVCPPAVATVRGIWVLGRLLHTGQRARSPQAPTPGTWTCPAEAEGAEPGKERAGLSPPLWATSGPSRLLFFLIQMLILTSRPHCFPSIYLRPQEPGSVSHRTHSPGAFYTVIILKKVTGLLKWQQEIVTPGRRIFSYFISSLFPPK